MLLMFACLAVSVDTQTLHTLRGALLGEKDMAVKNPREATRGRQCSTVILHCLKTSLAQINTTYVLSRALTYYIYIGYLYCIQHTLNIYICMDGLVSPDTQK